VFDAFALGIRLLHLFSREGGDALSHDLRRRKCTAKRDCRQDKGFGDRVIPFNIIGWIGFGIAQRLCLCECFCIV